MLMQHDSHAMRIEMSHDLDPVSWEQFKHSRLNRTGSDDEAKRMFARDQAEIDARQWTWYRQHYHSDEEAQAAWRRQRLRYGLPVPPVR